MKTLIIYHSAEGICERMAQAIARGAEKNGEVILKKVEEANPSELLDADVIILGSPCYFANMSWQMKKFIDDSVEFYEKLKGKKGGCFVASATLKDGKDALLALRLALEIHGMEVEEGPISVGVPTEEFLKECESYGERITKP
ncbi:MAG: flavodoxin family protein [bacterium]